MLANLDDPRIQKIQTPPRSDASGWQQALQRFEAGDVTVTRQTTISAALPVTTTAPATKSITTTRASRAGSVNSAN